LFGRIVVVHNRDTTFLHRAVNHAEASTSASTCRI